MRVTLEQMKKGMARYMDEEIINKTSGLAKWGLALASVAIVEKASSMVEKNADMLHTIGYVTDDGMIDLDLLYNHLLKVAEEKGSVTQHLPLVGDITFSTSDIQSVRRYIAS